MAKKKRVQKKRKPSTDPVTMAAKVFATMPGDGKPKIRLAK